MPGTVIRLDVIGWRIDRIQLRRCNTFANKKIIRHSWSFGGFIVARGTKNKRGEILIWSEGRVASPDIDYWLKTTWVPFDGNACGWRKHKHKVHNLKGVIYIDEIGNNVHSFADNLHGIKLVMVENFHFAWNATLFEKLVKELTLIVWVWKTDVWKQWYGFSLFSLGSNDRFSWYFHRFLKHFWTLTPYFVMNMISAPSFLKNISEWTTETCEKYCSSDTRFLAFRKHVGVSINEHTQ